MALKYRPQGKKFDAIAQEVRGEPAIGDDMDKFVLRLKPELYMRTYLNQRKTRLDGRDFHDWRNFEIICGAKRTALNSCVVGTACVSNGSTQVFASVELKSALESDPLLQFEVRPGCSGRDFTWARRVEILISEVYTAPDLAKALRLKVTLLSLSDGGALIDACFLAASAALTDSRIPPTTFDAERNLISVNSGSVHSLEYVHFFLFFHCQIQVQSATILFDLCHF
uniref:Ribosomal RNA-processing protein 42 n=1 Tax=Aureoumbra lagunensis TaxID=44058 RepID=A0A7S3JQL7_9STRA